MSLSDLIEASLWRLEWMREKWTSSPGAERLDQLRRHHLFLPSLLGGLVFLSLTIAGITTDEALSRAFRQVNLSMHESSPAWWAMAWALLSLGILSLSRRDASSALRFIVLALALAILTRYDLRLARANALPYIALRESSDRFGYFLLALALWRFARLYPFAASLVVTFGMVIIAISRWKIGEEPSPIRPDIFPLLYSIPLALSALLDARSRSGRGRIGWSDPRPVQHMLAVVFGGTLGGILQLIEQYRPNWDQVVAAAGDLWSQSVIAGHGHATLIRLLKVYVEPQEMLEPRWMGWTGTLATGGIATIAILTLVSACLVWKESRLGIANRGAALASQFTVGLLIFGGPNSLLPLLILAVWLALAFADIPPNMEGLPLTLDRQAWSRRLATGVVASLLLVMAGYTLHFRRPFVATERLNRLALKSEASAEATRDLDKAESLHPWSPVPHLIRAAWLRTKLTRAPRWDEALYRTICREYETARRLDPYEPTVALKLADVQTIAERTDDALDTVEHALQDMPGSVELSSWTYFHATSHNRIEEARKMLHRHLALDPGNIRWWGDLFYLERDAGRGGRADHAFRTALTGVIGSDEELERNFLELAVARQEGRL